MGSLHLQSQPAEGTKHAYIFALSAKDQTAFDKKRSAVISQLQEKPDQRIQDLSYMSLRRIMHEKRLFLSVNSSQELLETLEDSNVQPVETSPSDKVPRIVAIFSGQGANFPGMGRGLFSAVESFRSDVLRCDEVVQSLGVPSMIPYFQQNSNDSWPPRQSLAQAHCAAFALQYALARLWQSWGISLHVTLGHSLGEYAAFVVAGVLTMQEAITLLAHRGRLIDKHCNVGKSGMLSVRRGAKELCALLEKYDLTSVSVACNNSPDDCVLSFSCSEFSRLDQILESHSIKRKRLDIPLGFHSPQMEGLRHDFDQLATQTHLKPPSILLGLGLTGEMSTTNMIDHTYFAAQTISPVRFREAVQSCAESLDGSDIVFLEVGAHPVLLSMVKASMPAIARPGTCLGSLNKSRNDLTSLANTLVELARLGVHVRWRQTFAPKSARLVDLPLYPFSDKEFQISSRPPPAHSNSLSPENKPFVCPSPSNGVYDVDAGISSLAEGHRVAGFLLCPASVYIELAAQAYSHSQTGTRYDAFCMTDVSFPVPLVAQAGQPLESIGIRVDETQSCITFEVKSSRGRSGQPPAAYCLGTISRPSESHVGSGDMRRWKQFTAASLIRRKMLYNSIFTRVVEYSSMYQTIDWLEIDGSGYLARGSFRMRQEAIQHDSVTQPVLIDSLLHAAGFLSNCSVSSTEVCICTRFAFLHTVVSPAPDWSESFEIYSQISPTKHGFTGSSQAVDHEGCVIASIEGVEFRTLPLVGFQRSLSRVSSKSKEPLQLPAQPKVQQHSFDPSKSHQSGILRVLQQVTGISELDKLKNSPFSALGVDSLMILELLELLHDEYPILSSVPEASLLQCRSASELARLVDQAMHQDNELMEVVIAEPSTSGSEGDTDSKSLSIPTPVESVSARENSPQCQSVSCNGLDTICHAIAEVTGVPPGQVFGHSRLDHLGLDSLTIIELEDLLGADGMAQMDQLNLGSCQSTLR